MTLNSMAVQKELILNPGIKWSQSMMIIVLITNKNNPSVNIVTGNVNNTKIGFTKKFSKPNTIATVNAVVNLSISTPFITLSITKTSIDVISIRTSSFIFID